MASGLLGSPSLQLGLRRGLRCAFHGGKVSPTVLTFASLLTLFQLLCLALLAVVAVRSFLLSRGDLYVEVLPQATDQDVQELYATLRELPYVSRVEYVSAEQAYEREKARRPDVVAFVETYKLSNPYPDSFLVRLSSLSQYASFLQLIGSSQWQTVVDPSFLSSVTGQEQDVRSLLSVLRLLMVVTGVLGFFAIVTLLFAVVELIGRRARHHGRGLQLELLLGLKPADVIVPFAAEMTVLLLIGLLGATLIVLLLSFALPFLTSDIAQGTAFLDLRRAFESLLITVGPLVFIAEILLLPVLAAAGALLGMRRGLPVPALLRRA